MPWIAKVEGNDGVERIVGMGDKHKGEMGTGGGGEEAHPDPRALRCQHVPHVRSLDSIKKLNTWGGFGCSLDGGEERWQGENCKPSIVYGWKRTPGFPEDFQAKETRQSRSMRKYRGKMCRRKTLFLSSLHKPLTGMEQQKSLSGNSQSLQQDKGGFSLLPTIHYSLGH